MDTSLNQVQGLREEQVEFEGGWKGFLRHVTQDVEDFQQRIMDRLRVGAMNLDGAFSKLMERVDDAQVQSKNGILELNTVTSSSLHLPERRLMISDRFSGKPMKTVSSGPRRLERHGKAPIR